jgi:hypothetical protein
LDSSDRFSVGLIQQIRTVRLVEFLLRSFQGPLGLLSARHTPTRPEKAAAWEALAQTVTQTRRPLKPASSVEMPSPRPYLTLHPPSGPVGLKLHRTVHSMALLCPFFALTPVHGFVPRCIPACKSSPRRLARGSFRPCVSSSRSHRPAGTPWRALACRDQSARPFLSIKSSRAASSSAALSRIPTGAGPLREASRALRPVG